TMITKLRTGYDLNDEIRKMILAGRNARHHVVNQRLIGQDLSAAQGIAQQLGRQRAVELLLLVLQIMPEPLGVRNAGSVAERSRRIDRRTVAVFVSPAANGVVVF